MDFSPKTLSSTKLDHLARKLPRSEGKRTDEKVDGRKNDGPRSADGNRVDDRHGERGDDKQGSHKAEGETNKTDKPDKVRTTDDTSTKADPIKGGKIDGRTDGGRSNGANNGDSVKGDRAEGKSGKSDKANKVF